MRQARNNNATRPAWPGASGWRATLSACAASLVGIGLARFAYTPLLPAIIDAHWFAPTAAAYLGAANLGGYLAGALMGRPLAARIPVPLLLRALMLLATTAFFACSIPVSFLWFFAWRLLSGIAGGALMVLAAPSVLPHIPSRRRGVASGVIFGGVGLGIAASGSLVPILLRQGLTEAWWGLGLLSLVLTVVAWSGWPAATAPMTPPTITPAAIEPGRTGRPTRQLRALYLEYGLNAAGLVPHMLFLVDYVARGLGQGLDSGARYWVLFGLGAVVGPVLSGHLADRVGYRSALRLAFLVQTIGVLLAASGTGTAGLIVSSLVIGAFTPGIVPLVLGRIHELLPYDMAARNGAWSAATASFALLQATSAYGLTFIFARTGGNYRLLFLTGAAAFLTSLALDLVAGGGAARRDAA